MKNFLNLVSDTINEVVEEVMSDDNTGLWPLLYETEYSFLIKIPVIHLLRDFEGSIDAVRSYLNEWEYENFIMRFKGQRELIEDILKYRELCCRYAVGCLEAACFEEDTKEDFPSLRKEIKRIESRYIRRNWLLELEVNLLNNEKPSRTYAPWSEDGAGLKTLDFSSWD